MALKIPSEFLLNDHSSQPSSHSTALDSSEQKWNSYFITYKDTEHSLFPTVKEQTFPNADLWVVATSKQKDLGHHLSNHIHLQPYTTPHCYRLSTAFCPLFMFPPFPQMHFDRIPSPESNGSRILENSSSHVHKKIRMLP